MTDPAEPAAHLPPAPPPKPMSTAFWVWIGFGVVMIILALGIWRLGPKLWPKASPQIAASAPAQAAVTPDVSAAALKARVAELEQALAQARLAQAAPAASAAALNTGAAQALGMRLDRLEASERRAARAAAAAVAAGALDDAAQTSRPFAGELAVLERLLPDPSLVAGLRPLADTGAPTRAALASEFPDVAARAAAAAHAPGKGASVLTRILAALGSMISIRRTDDLTGTSPDAVLARAERRVAEGDIEGAVEQLKGLPSGGQAATADWRERARRRIEIERRIARLRTQALNDLAGQAPAAEGAGQ